MDKEFSSLPEEQTPPPTAMAAFSASKKKNPSATNPNKEILRKSITPKHLQVPKPSEFPERYRSPTDLIVSPVSRRLLSRSSNGGSHLARSKSSSIYGSGL